MAMQMSAQSRGVVLKKSVSGEALCGWSLVLFFSQDAVSVLISSVLSFLSYDIQQIFMILLIYAPLILSIFLRSRNDYRYLGRFLICLGSVFLIFLVTYMLHPEYHTWFFEGSYPVGERIFKPNRYLYAMLFVGAIKRPEELIRYMRIAAYVLLAYYSYRLLKAKMQGYWITTTTSAGPTKTEYDLNYGYDHLLVFAVFCASAFKEKKLKYAILAIVSVVEIFLGGSRGPLLGVAAMLCIMYFKYRKSLSKLLRVLVVLAVVSLLVAYLLLGFEGLMIMIGTVLTQLGISSRTVTSFLGGSSVLDNTGRDRLYAMAWDMVREGFWGYGAYGDRFVIGKVFWVGYVHNIFLELLIDFGWIAGGGICILLVYQSVKMLVFCKDEAWWICFVIFFVPITKLFMSGSFWFSEVFWAAIAVWFGYRTHLKAEAKTGG